MPIPGSTTVPAAIALLAAIVTQVNDPAVGIFEGPPGTYQPDDMIYLSRIEGIDETQAMVGGGGQHSLQEHYFIEVTISVFRGGDDSQATLQRAGVLSDLVVAAVRTDPSLAGTVSWARPAQFLYEQAWHPENLGRLVTVTRRFDCRAEL